MKPRKSKALLILLLPLLVAARGEEIMSDTFTNEDVLEKFVFATQFAITQRTPTKFDLGLLDIFDLPGDNTEKRKTHTLRNPKNDLVPFAPVIHQYHTPGAEVPLVISFPLSFRLNIPDSVKDAVSKNDIDHLDLFFVPQRAIPGQTLPANLGKPTEAEIQAAIGGVLDDDIQPGLNPQAAEQAKRQIALQSLNEARAAANMKASLKPAFWADPVMPNFGTLRSQTPGGSFTRWHHDIRMAVYDSNRPIEHEVRLNELRSFHTNIHDGRISDSKGELDLKVSDLNYSFWSLVISPVMSLRVNTTDRRNDSVGTESDLYKAAVTLHWLMDDETYFAFLNQVRASKTLMDLLTHLESDPVFQRPGNKHLLDKLKFFAS